MKYGYTILYQLWEGERGTIYLFYSLQIIAPLNL